MYDVMAWKCIKPIVVPQHLEVIAKVDCVESDTRGAAMIYDDAAMSSRKVTHFP